MARPIRERFWSKVDRSGECWLWMRGEDTSGYGTFRLAKTSDRAHRVAWSMERGDIPPGKYVLHCCDNRRCVRPDHLYIGTHADNMRDMIARGRARKARGEAHHKTRLTNDAVREIRRRSDLGETRGSISRLMGIPRTTVSRIARRQHWTHI